MECIRVACLSNWSELVCKCIGSCFKEGFLLALFIIASKKVSISIYLCNIPVGEMRSDGLWTCCIMVFIIMIAFQYVLNTSCHLHSLRDIQVSGRVRIWFRVWTTVLGHPKKKNKTKSDSPINWACWDSHRPENFQEYPFITTMGPNL